MLIQQVAFGHCVCAHGLQITPMHGHCNLLYTLYTHQMRKVCTDAGADQGGGGGSRGSGLPSPLFEKIPPLALKILGLQAAYCIAEAKLVAHMFCTPQLPIVEAKYVAGSSSSGT